MNRSMISSTRAAASFTRKINCRAFMSMGRAANRIPMYHGEISTKSCMKMICRQMASESLSNPNTESSAPIMIYEGKYSTKLWFLRVVSFGSTFFCCVGLPLGFCFTGMAGTVPIIGQVLIASTAMLISISSTTFLQLVTHPYTVALHELPQKLKEGEVLEFENRQFRATRLNLLGKRITTEFCIKDASRIKTGHPFASVKIKGSYFYIFGRHIPDVPLRHALTSEI
jgi:hypothetical protein